MKPKVTVYVTVEELAQLKKAAARQRSSISLYAKHRLILPDDEGLGGNGIAEPGGALSATVEQKLVDSVRKPLIQRMDALAENLRTLIVMLDQLVKSTLIHLPEIPPAQHQERLAAGERRHRSWQQEVENLLRQLRETNANQHQSGGNGAHA